MWVERVEVGIGRVDAEFDGFIGGEGAQVGETLFAREGCRFVFFAIAVVLSCGGLLWEERTADREFV